MEKILYFDFAAVLLLLMLLITTIARGLTKGRVNKIFVELVLLSVITAVSDIFAVWLDRLGAGNLELKYVAHICYLLFHNAMTPAYMLFLLILSDSDHKMKGIMRLVFSVPFLIVLVALLTNPLHNQVFYFNEQDAYTRGNLFWLLYVCAISYSLFGVYNVFRYRKLYGNAKFMALFGMFPILLGAMIVQMLWPHMLCEMFANAVGLLLVSMMGQRPEEILDIDSGLGKEGAYIDAMRRSMRNRKSRAVVMINLINFESLRDMLGYMEMKPLIFFGYFSP